MKSILLHIFPACMLTLALFSCSTTELIPDGESLYQGVNSIRYLKPGEKMQKKLVGDSRNGVIISIASAAEQVKNALDDAALSSMANSNQELSVEDKKLFRQNEKALDEALRNVSPEVNAVLEYPPNNSFFGSAYYRTPLPIGLWAYNAYSEKKTGFSRFMYKAFAGEPVLISTVNPDMRIKVAENTLHNYGFFQGKVKFNILSDSHDSKKAKINYYVSPGKVYLLDSISYKGFPLVADTLLKRTLRRSYLHSGDPFNVQNLTEEQNRLETVFRNRGLYFYRSSSAIYEADTLMKPYRVQLIMKPHNTSKRTFQPYYIGRTIVNLSDRIHSSQSSYIQTSNFRTMTINWSSNREKLPLRPGVLLRNIAHHQGSLYRKHDEDKTQEMLSALGIFSQVSLSYIPQDTTLTCDSLNLRIDAVLDQPYTSDFEMNVTVRNNDRIGPGLSWNLQRKNAFRGAELINFQLYGDYEWHTSHEQAKGIGKFLNSYEVGTVLSLDIPRVVFPGISRRRFRFPTATSFSFKTDWLNRPNYFNLFSTSIGVTYSWNRTNSSKHEFTPFNLTYDKQIHTTATFDSIRKENPALYLSTRDRFVPSMSYVYTYTSPRRSRKPLWWQLTVKEAGNITSCVYAAGGKSFNEKNKNLLGNPFAQYLKLSTELHNTFPLTENLKLVTRLMGGAVWSYGNATIAPYSDLFFAGGAASIRGFTIRTLGPGHYRVRHSKYSYMDQTGDLKLEANAELRFPVFGSLGGALFLDAGNVWLLRKDENRPGGEFQLQNLAKDIALGTGFGLRYDMSFLVLRFDLGVALHDPSLPGYFNLNKLSQMLTFHFAIGYPF